MKPDMALRTATALLLVVSSVTASRSATASPWETDLESAEKFALSGQTGEGDQLFKKALGEAPDDTARATIINHRGVVQMKQHLYASANNSFREALELRNKVLGETAPGTLQTLSNLALSTYKNGDEEKAEKLYLECIEKKRKVAPKSESLAITLTNLGNLYGDLRNCGEAKRLYLEAAQIDSALFGSEHTQVAGDFYNTGVVLQKCQDPKDALTYLEKAHAIYATLKDQYGQVKTLHYIGLCHADLKNFEKSSEYSIKALTLHEQLKGHGHSDTIVHMLAAGDSLLQAGKDAEAEKHYLKALRTARAEGRTDNLRLTECNLALARLYKKQNRIDDAEQLYKKALIHYESLSKKDKRELYELPLAYAQLLKELKQDQQSDHLTHKFLHVYAPGKGR